MFLYHVLVLSPINVEKIFFPRVALSYNRAIEYDVYIFISVLIYTSLIIWELEHLKIY